MPHPLLRGLLAVLALSTRPTVFHLRYHQPKLAISFATNSGHPRPLNMSTFRISEPPGNAGTLSSRNACITADMPLAARRTPPRVTLHFSGLICQALPTQK